MKIILQSIICLVLLLLFLPSVNAEYYEAAEVSYYEVNGVREFGDLDVTGTATIDTELKIDIENNRTSMTTTLHDSYGTSSSKNKWVFRKSHGTHAAPTDVLPGEYIFYPEVQAYVNGAWQTVSKANTLVDWYWDGSTVGAGGLPSAYGLVLNDANGDYGFPYMVSDLNTNIGVNYAYPDKRLMVREGDLEVIDNHDLGTDILATVGAMTAGTGWTAILGCTMVSDAVTCTDDGTFYVSAVNTDLPGLKKNTWYEIEYDVTALSCSPDTQLDYVILTTTTAADAHDDFKYNTENVTGVDGQPIGWLDASGYLIQTSVMSNLTNYTQRFRSGANQTVSINFQVEMTLTSSCSITFDNISFKEITGGDVIATGDVYGRQFVFDSDSDGTSSTTYSANETKLKANNFALIDDGGALSCNTITGQDCFLFPIPTNAAKLKFWTIAGEWGEAILSNDGTAAFLVNSATNPQRSANVEYQAAIASCSATTLCLFDAGTQTGLLNNAGADTVFVELWRD